MVDPTKRKPCCFSALERASDSAVLAGTSRWRRQRFLFDVCSTKPQTNRSKLPNSFCTASRARALLTALSTLRRLRTMAGFFSSASTRRRSNRATRAGSNSAKALR